MRQGAAVSAGSVRVVKGQKAAPVLVYNGSVLTKKDYRFAQSADSRKKWNEDGTMVITGSGNFTGTRTIAVQVVEKGALQKIGVKWNKPRFVYDGTEHKLSSGKDFVVIDAKTKQPLTDTEYRTVYAADVTRAGTVRVTFIGMNAHTGSITETYQIQPNQKADDILVSAPNADGYAFVSTGVTAYQPVVSVSGTVLLEGTDYMLTYHNHKKVGTATCKISFLGKSSKGKAGIYQSVPYLIENETSVLLKTSAFRITYYVDKAMTKEMKGSSGKLTEGTVYLKIEPKGKKSNYTGVAYASYEVHADGKDLAKAKIVVTPKKTQYTGSSVGADTIQCAVYYDGEDITDLTDICYGNNIAKGKASILVTGRANGFIGAKTASFTIVPSDIKTTK